VSRTFYARGQTGQQLLLGVYSELSHQISAGTVKMYPRHEMLDLVLVDGHAKGIITRNMVTGEIQSHAADAVILATGGYGNAFYLSTNAMGCNVTATYRAYRRGALFANPCFTQIHPTCIPVSGEYQSKLTLMSESLRNDGRVWVPKRKEDCGKKPSEIPEEDRDYFLERKYPSYGNLAPRDISSRSAKEVCDEGRGVGPGGLGVYMDFADAIKRLGENTVRERYGNLFEMYENITGENAYKTPMRIYPAVHYTMGGLWVDYELQSNIPGLFVIGEANFSDHGANRLGASALMTGILSCPTRSATTWHRSAARVRSPTGRNSSKPRKRCATASTACFPSRVNARWTVSTRKSANCSGMNAAWRGARRGWRKRSSDSMKSAKSFGVTSRFWVTATNSTSRSRKPGAWPTSSISAS
jgi:succinate dehydrogenase / fumarate reductase flavoprotein subunit